MGVKPDNSNGPNRAGLYCNGPQLTSPDPVLHYDYVLTVSDGICSIDTVSVTVPGGPSADARGG